MTLSQSERSPASLWETAKDQLQLQMTQATFDTQLASTRLISAANGNWQITVKTEAAKEWLENRLYDTISRTVANLLGHPIEIEFVIDLSGDNDHPTKAETPATVTEEFANDDASSTKVEPPDPGLTFAQDTDFHAIKTKMGRWLPELQYDHIFWGAYLGGQTWLFYRHLLMHWIKNLRKKDLPLLDMENAEHHWTSPFRLSYRKAVQWLGKSNQKIVPGGIYECHQSDAHHRILKQTMVKCCGSYTPHDWKPQPEGGGRCYYWRPGLLHHLYDEHLLAIEVSDAGRATVQVWRNLPLLTPHQVGSLNSFLQDQHERWIEDNGHLYNDLTLDRWLTFPQLSHVPHMPVYADRQKLHGQPPKNPLLKKDEDE